MKAGEGDGNNCRRHNYEKELYVLSMLNDAYLTRRGIYNYLCMWIWMDG